MVWRWACGLCGATFRLLPPFLEPYKRYATFAIDEMASRVIEPYHSSYRKASQRSGADPRRILHNWNSGDTGLAHTTIWRWVTWMSAVTLAILKLQPEAGSDESILKAEQSRCHIPPERWMEMRRLDQIHRARWLKRNRKLGEDRLPRICNNMN